MSLPPIDYLITPSVHLLTILITCVSAFYVYKQEILRYRHVRSLLLLVHFFFVFLVFFEFLRNFPVFYQNNGYMIFYTDANTTFVLIDVLLLTLVALAVYYKPSGPSFRSLFAEMLSRPLQLFIFAVFLVYVVVVDAYLFVPPQPFTIMTNISNIAGVPISATVFDPFYLNLLLIVLIVFAAYPSLLLLLASRQTLELQIRNALRILPLAWIGIGLDILVFNGYLLTLSPPIDASALGYLFAAIAFSLTAAIFRRATLLSGFFQQVPLGQALPKEHPFSTRLGLVEEDVVGKNFLLEVDPSSRFEDAVKDFALEFASNNYLVFTFTSRGRPVYNALAKLEGIRFYTFSAKVSYPRPTDQSNEVLVPQNDQSVILNVLDKTVSANPDVKIAVIFDSVTDLLLSAGFDNAYKFLKQANEIVSEARVAALFILTMGAHDDKQTNVVRSLFTNHLSFEGSELKLVRS
ncbi:MAG TPA: hypothetical protein VEJ36_08410 [Nitrososphaerales archaeon]|nr:hypothetical protein [Nitrososphaerales archaeon]